MPTALEVYKTLSVLNEDPKKFKEKADEIIEEFVQTLPHKSRRKARTSLWESLDKLLKRKPPSTPAEGMDTFLGTFIQNK